MRVLVLTLILFWLQLCVRAARLAMEGNGNITGYGGTIYTAHKYRPICGLLAKGRFREDFDILTTCQPAMKQYRETNDTFSLYGLTGIRLSDTAPIGRDEELCMCFSLADIDGVQSNMCIYVLGDGTTSDYIDSGLYIGWGTSFAVGSFKFGNKALPACYDISYDEVVASIDAAGDATRVQVQPPPRTSTTAVSTTSNTSASTNSQTISPQDTALGSTPPPNVSQFIYTIWGYSS
jgi:hypothetical protein